MEAHTERRWVCKEPTTQYGWVRLGMESINSHKSGWRSHTLTVLLILSIPMAWAARCALVCVQKSTHTQLREESYAQYHSHKYIVYINIYATTYINQDSVSDTQQRKRSTKNQACKRNVALPSHSPQFNSCMPLILGLNGPMFVPSWAGAPAASQPPPPSECEPVMQDRQPGESGLAPEAQRYASAPECEMPDGGSGLPAVQVPACIDDVPVLACGTRNQNPESPASQGLGCVDAWEAEPDPDAFVAE